MSSTQTPTRSSFINNLYQHTTLNFPASDPNCSICLDPYPTSLVVWNADGTLLHGPQHIATKMPCGHFFGFACIWKWLNELSSTCPMCRASFFEVKEVEAVPELVVEYVGYVETVQMRRQVVEFQYVETVRERRTEVETVDVRQQVRALRTEVETVELRQQLREWSLALVGEESVEEAAETREEGIVWSSDEDDSESESESEGEYEGVHEVIRGDWLVGRDLRAR
ncbi:uncharacterized protein N0V89_009413 [Didymosphaeria variabile]|uniref:RING-type domain-containing protein n=1 Tax=Didymosphaeria variabile TaxID=1932322 RepID=A0A9W9C791_9PLEO|nr:uncharacterized protein N0V89_009413 [Didymosphaeria variabile]KAJ4348041.1 hypothetical protein N0V89_009413 [Didymosphaeria variabile]